MRTPVVPLATALVLALAAPAGTAAGKAAGTTTGTAAGSTATRRPGVTTATPTTRAPKKKLKKATAGRLGKGALAVIDPKDTMTTVRGLTTALERSKVAHTDLTKDVAKGKLPLTGVRVLMVGSFATSHEKTRETLAAKAAAVQEFVAGGGVLVVLAQADEVWAKSPLLGDGVVAKRGDLDYDTPHLLLPEHPLFAGLDAEALSAWEVDAGPFRYATGYRGAYDAFSEVAGLTILAARDKGGSYPAIVEGVRGRGKILLLQLAPDEVSVSPAFPEHREPAQRLLDNLLAYAATLSEGTSTHLASAELLASLTDSTTGLLPDPLPSDWRATTRKVDVEVFEDRNGNGRRDSAEPGLSGMQVTIGWKIHISDKKGHVSLALGPEDGSVVASVKVPVTHEATTPFWHRALGPETVRFGLRRRTTPTPERFSFLQLTDIHIGAHSALADESELRARVEELNALRPRPAFLLSSGDVTASAKTAEFMRYRDALGDLEIPVLTSCGNHDRHHGHEKWDGFEREIGPVVFSFDYGRYHFTTAYESFPGSPVFDWLAEDLRRAGDRPTILFMHHYPRRKFLDALVGRGVIAVITGDWHGNKIETYKGIVSVNTSTVLVGGIDHSPASFRLFHAGPDGLTAELRYVRATERITVVSPPSVVPAGATTPIIVNAYDTVRRPTKVTYALRTSAGKTLAPPAHMLSAVHASPAGTLRPPGVMEADAPVSGALTSTSEWSWRGPLPRLPKGAYVLEVTAHADDGTSWTTRARFKVKAGTPPKVRLGKESWPMFRHDAARTGVAATEVRTPLRLAWVLGTRSSVGMASPVVADGRVYLPLEDRASMTRPESGVLAANATTGERLWTYRTDSAVVHSVAVADGVVVLQEVNGTIHALDAKSGKRIWKHELDGEREPVWASHWVSGAPIIDGDVVWAGYHVAPLALELKSGKRLWLGPALGREAFTLYASLALGTIAMDATKPDEKRSVLMVPSLHDGMRAFAFDEAPKKGKGAKMPEVLWSSRSRHRVASTPVLRDGIIYYTRGRSLAAFDAVTGDQLWKRSLPGGWHVSTPLVTDDTIYFATARGALAALERETGDRRWETTVGPSLLDVLPYRRGYASLSSSPALSGELLYVGGNDGYLRAIRASDGRVIWKYYLGAAVSSSPAVVGNAVFVAAMDGNLYCFVGR